MTTWTSETSSSTSWNSGDGINEVVSILYNTALPYNIDYITYNGYYVEDNTDWAAGSQVQTAWKE